MATELHQVVWSNVWNWTHSGGHGSRVHLTKGEGITGVTLCGKPYPRCKGHPIGVYVCKRCLKKAAITIPEMIKLSHIPSALD